MSSQHSERYSRLWYSDELKERVALAYVLNGDPAAAIAKRYGVSVTSVFRWARERYPEQTIKKAQIYTSRQAYYRERDRLLPEIFGGLGYGESLRTIADRLGVSATHVANLLRVEGYESLIPAPRKRAIPLDLKRAVVEAYNRNEGSLVDLGKRFGVSATSVQRWAIQDALGEL